MAKKRSTVPRELDKTIKVNDETYNINAVEATHVKNALTLQQSKIEGPSTREFDGSSEMAINYVPSSGGVYDGPVRVPNIKNSNGDINANAIIENDKLKINEKAVLNYHDTVNIVVRELAKNAVFYEFAPNDIEDEQLTPKVTNGSINGISIIRGMFSHLGQFVQFNQAKQYFSSFLYICTNDPDPDAFNNDDHDGEIYYGTCNSTDIELLAKYAQTSKKLVSNRIQGSRDRLEYTAEDIQNLQNKINSVDSNLSEQIDLIERDTAWNTTDHNHMWGYINELRDITYNENYKIAGVNVAKKAINADNASKATSDASNRDISTTYYKIANEAGLSVNSVVNYEDTSKRKYADKFIVISTSSPDTNDKIYSNGSIWIQI